MGKQEIKDFQKHILRWYRKHKRNLPWRRTKDPYAILISEVMLQQTQVSRVVPKFEQWMKEFPNVQSLANAKTRDVLRLWSGLGYNRRALYLQKAAQKIIADCKGKFPRSEEELVRLPGIGVYTARAVLCFAFNKQVAVMDTNVRKVILTQFAKYETNSKVQDNEIQKIADTLLPPGKARDWNQALMDYASSELKKEKIPIKKQATFKNSNRYYRGQIVKKLIAEGRWGIGDARKELALSEEKMRSIIEGLVKDGLIALRGDAVVLV